MKTKSKKILNLIKSLKTQTSLSVITLTSCLTIALFFLMTSKAAATYFATQNYLEYAFEGATTKEIAIFTICVVLLLAAPEEIKKLIRKHNKRKIDAGGDRQPTQNQRKRQKRKFLALIFTAQYWIKSNTEPFL